MLAREFTYGRAGQCTIHCLIACCNLAIKDAHGTGKVHRSQLSLCEANKSLFKLYKFTLQLYLSHCVSISEGKRVGDTGNSF